MADDSYSLADLSEMTGIEPRTIRSYIERGLLPGAQNRGRGSTYSGQHLAKLCVIQSLRRARPNVTLGEIRMLLHRMSPEQIAGLARGSLGAAADAVRRNAEPDSPDAEVSDATNEQALEPEAGAVSSETAVERLVSHLRGISRLRPTPPSSRSEAWQRIMVTPDIELAVRAEFDAGQLAAFRELADLLRHLLQHGDVLRPADEQGG